MLADSGPGQTTLTYDDLLAPDFSQMQKDSPDRLVLGGQPCTYYWAPDNRKITNKKVREALQFAYPYKNAILAAGLIPGVNAIPSSNLMPPGVPGRTPYNTTGHKAFQTDPAKAKELLKSANAMGYEIKFLFRTDDSVNVKVKDAIVKALTEAGFKATPVPTTTANYVAARDNTSEDINVRSAGWCSDWPSGSTWLPPVLGSTDPSTRPLLRLELQRVQQQGCRHPDGRHPADADRAAGSSLEQPGQADRPEVLPAVHDLLRRHRPGPRVEDPGRQRRQHAGHADLEGHVDLAVVTTDRRPGLR